ncbi:Gfo/Idh/MocA family protein [Amycolatopsis sp. DSM 110486]|uniref:Gfo/Idh/MocA family protein n=1 Tax=Amycolatopsis sp. DSM 110486 TaxID=2865832 RepID=UPI001C6A15CD|nr:Gfo/Idh/MocA family oxidoreductase [Amycolatopsis sp. DSM 110486]
MTVERDKTIGVGIVGGSTGGWAALGHVPALRALPGYDLRAVSTSRQESAEAAAKEFGADAAYDNHANLIADPAVDLVVVAVKIAHHREIISAALSAGKTVYSEWPWASASRRPGISPRWPHTPECGRPSGCRRALPPRSTTPVTWSPRGTRAGCSAARWSTPASRGARPRTGATCTGTTTPTAPPP